MWLLKQWRSGSRTANSRTAVPASCRRVFRLGMDFRQPSAEILRANTKSIAQMLVISYTHTACSSQCHRLCAPCVYCQHLLALLQSRLHGTQ